MAGSTRLGVVTTLLVLALPLQPSCLTVADGQGPILSIDLYWDEDPDPRDEDYIDGTCETSGVETMAWRLLDQYGATVQGSMRDDSKACVTAAERDRQPCFNAIDVVGLDPGTYELEICGFDDDGRLGWSDRSGALEVLRFDVVYALEIESGP